MANEAHQFAELTEAEYGELLKYEYEDYSGDAYEEEGDE